MAAGAALFGTIVMFVGAWLNEKTREFFVIRGIVQFLAFLPMAVPGLVLGLGYIFFFNAPNNPLNFLYATMGILVVNTVAHFYTVGHLTATTALKQIDPEFESVSASLKVPVWRTFARVTAPICLPAILDIAIYLFVNAMTTVSVGDLPLRPRHQARLGGGGEHRGERRHGGRRCALHRDRDHLGRGQGAARAGRPLPAGPPAGLAAALAWGRATPVARLRWTASDRARS